MVAAFVAGRQPEIAGAATSGAALAVADLPPRPKRVLLRILGRIAPRLRMNRPIAPEALSRDPEVGRAYAADPSVLRRMTLGFGAAFLDAVQRTLPAAAKVRVPMLLLHGADDALCPPEGSRAFHAGLSAPAGELRIYPGLRHEILNEPERETVLADLLEWMRRLDARARPDASAAPTELLGAARAG